MLDDKALIKKYKTKINMLLKRLQEVKNMESEIEKLQQAEQEKKSLEESNATLVKRLSEQEAIRISLEEKISRLTKLILVSTSIATPAKLRYSDSKYFYHIPDSIHSLSTTSPIDGEGVPVLLQPI